eukprot:gene7525-8323_t
MRAIGLYLIVLAILISAFEINATGSFLRSSKKEPLDLSRYRTLFTSYGHEFKEEARFLNHGGIVKQDAVLADAGSSHTVVFAIQQKNVDQLHSILMDVSTPSSPNYGQHWTRQQVSELTSNAAGMEEVVSFLRRHEISVDHVSKFGEYVVASAPVSLWEVFFKTRFEHFYDKVEDVHLLRAMHYSLPTPIHQHLAGVFGVADYFPNRLHPKDRLSPQSFASPSNEKKLAGATYGNNGNPWYLTATVNGAQVKVYLTYPQLLYNYYSIDSPYGNANVTQAVFGSLGQEVSMVDVNQFQAGFGLLVHDLAGYNASVSDNACYEDTGNCDEASLDVQYIMSIAQNVSTYYEYYEISQVDDFVNWIIEVANSDDPPGLYSVSYGGYEMGLTKDQLTTFNTEAQKLGIMGTSIIVSSGDDGVAGNIAEDDASNCDYRAAFPSVSPYVTSVGATVGPESGKSEVTCQVPLSTITSGGGFSAQPSVNARPEWQTAAVTNYFNTVSPKPQNGYGSGRGYPDISMMGNNYFIITNQSINAVSGTSASAPVFAGVVSLANSVRKAKGQSSLGFLNPLLYANASLFVMDITVGNNSCTSASSSSVVGDTFVYSGVCCSEGFVASAGWDPVTGLGSVNVEKFLHLVNGDYNPTPNPTPAPSAAPTPAPSAVPTLNPTPAPSAVPTLNPTPAPSAAPTLNPTAQVYPVLSFSSQLTFQGISSSTFSETDESCITDAAASSMQLQADQVSFLSYSFVTTRRLLNEEGQGNAPKLLAQQTWVNISTSVFIYTGQNATTVYKSLTSSLSKAVQDGTYNTYLSSDAQQSGSTTLTTATATQVTNYPATEQPVPDDDDSGSNGLSDGALAGIIVGCVIGGLLVVGLIVYCVLKPRTSAPMAAKEADSRL